MRLPQQHSTLKRRDVPTDLNYLWTALAALAFLLVALVLMLKYLRSLRRRRPEPPAFLPTTYLRTLWRQWQPGNTQARSIPSWVGNEHSLEERGSTEIPTSTTQITEEDTSMGRRTSIRSVVTLPAYNKALLPNEQLIAREGERDGLDLVIDPPESEHEVEARREEEMQALFNIREARRQEQSDREARRQQRREARQRGDWARLEVLEAESRARAQQRAETNALLLAGELLPPLSRPLSTISTPGEPEVQTPQAAVSSEAIGAPESAYLIAELNALRENNQRSRRVSSVSYADLGTARHDGSRIRAESVESDRPLLGGAASFSGRRSRGASLVSTRGPSRSRSRAARHSSAGLPQHIRVPSSDEVSFHAGVPTIRNSIGDLSLVATRTTRSTTLDTRTLTPTTSNDAATAPAIDVEDPPPHPPSYDDDVEVHGGEAPPYSSPIRSTAPPIPTLTADPPNIGRAADGSDISGATHETSHADVQSVQSARSESDDDDGPRGRSRSPHSPNARSGPRRSAAAGQPLPQSANPTTTNVPSEITSPPSMTVVKSENHTATPQTTTRTSPPSTTTGADSSTPPGFSSTTHAIPTAYSSSRTTSTTANSSGSGMQRPSALTVRTAGISAGPSSSNDASSRDGSTAVLPAVEVISPTPITAESEGMAAFLRT